MQHDWLIHVLDDLKSYADANRLAVLSEQLKMARLVALTETASHHRDGGDPSDDPATGWAPPRLGTAEKV